MSTTTNDRTQELSKVPKVTALPEGCSVAIIDKSGAVLESIEADKFFQAVRDSIQIGGRNLLKGTSSEWQSQSVLNTAYTAPLKHIKDLGLKAGDRVILSMYMKPSAVGKKLRSRIEFYNSDSNRKTVFGTEVTDETEICLASGVIPPNYNYIRWGIDANLSADLQLGTTTEYYRCLKLEKGNIPTDWSPAPEDIIWGGVIRWFAGCCKALSMPYPRSRHRMRTSKKSITV